MASCFLEVIGVSGMAIASGRDAELNHLGGEVRDCYAQGHGFMSEVVCFFTNIE